MAEPAPDAQSAPTHAQLNRELGIFSALMLGLGSIVGTGVFVSLGLSAGIAGPAVVLAIALAAMLAACNGLSSAQLAAAHPVAGGTYEYGYTYLTPALGFTAGWLFLAAKSASAATAALGFAGYAWHLAPEAWQHVLPVGDGWRAHLVALAFVPVIGLMLLILTGIRRTNVVNIAIVTVTLLGLIAFTLAVLPVLGEQGQRFFSPFFDAEDETGPGVALLHATALMFVAYTGYGRIATMGEEIREPRRSIPIAIIITLSVSALLYMAVAAAAIAAVGSEQFSQFTRERAAPLEVIVDQVTQGRWWGGPASLLVSLAALTAMLGVLLNLILGLSRVALAMGRRGDLPGVFARLNAASTPVAAIVLVTAIIAALVMLGDVMATWSFSAFTVLIYYGITNLAALRLPRESRMYPRTIAWAGLVGCIGLAFFVEPIYWMAGLALIGLGLVWHAVARRYGP